MSTRPPALPPQKMRQLLLSALPEDTSFHGAAPEPRVVYFPSSHLKALRPNAMIVSGMRGAGKSFWWAALQRPEIRRLVERGDPNAEIRHDTEIALGFGETHNPEKYPDRDTLQQLLASSDGDARLVWRTVVVRQLMPADDRGRAWPGTWREWVYWVRANPEQVSRILAEKDAALANRHTWHLTLFDALDRSANDWETMHRLIRGILQLALDFRPYARLRVKCFLREDQLDESRIGDFPDASKVLASRVDLTWSSEDLYGMLWQHLANAKHEYAEVFRSEAETVLARKFQSIPLSPDSQTGAIYRVPPAAPERSRSLFHKLAGEWMGRDPRRGFPYTWVPNHLADARGRTSPRSFLIALRVAASDTDTRYPEHQFALHYESIKRGVQEASKIRVNELKEDYPWVDILMKPLHGLTVPCEFSAITQRWRKDPDADRLQDRLQQVQGGLPPAHLDEGFPGIRQDLEELGVFLRLRDGRVNIPDVFRVAYGLGRKGGVPPVSLRTAR